MNLQCLPLVSGTSYDGFEIAIYDLQGWRGGSGMPVYQLMGGAFRKRVGCQLLDRTTKSRRVGAIAESAQKQGF